MASPQRSAATSGIDVDDLDRAGIRTGTLVMTNRCGQVILTDRRGLDAGWSFSQFSITGAASNASSPMRCTPA